MKDTHLSRRYCLSWYEELWIYVVQVPFEAPATQSLSQLSSGSHIPVVAFVVADPLIIVLGVLVQPHLGQTH